MIQLRIIACYNCRTKNKLLNVRCKSQMAQLRIIACYNCRSKNKLLNVRCKSQMAQWRIKAWYNCWIKNKLKTQLQIKKQVVRFICITNYFRTIWKMYSISMKCIKKCESSNQYTSFATRLFSYRLIFSCIFLVI